MRKISYLFLITLLMSACKKNSTPEAQPVNVGIKVAYTLTNKTLPLADIEVKVKNLATGNTSSSLTNANGALTFESLAAGTYDITAKTVISAAVYSNLTGIQVTDPVTLNASILNKVISPNNAEPIELLLIAGDTSDWVIKQVYYSGSNTTDGALYRDQFVEIYNNSDHVLYADSLYFGELIGRQSATSTTYHLQSNGQLDWNKSIDMPTNIDANDDYIYSRALHMIPGTGKQNPVLPGKSIIIAQTALNHKQPFIGTDQKPISVRNPDLTIDLSGAQYEAYYAAYGANQLDSDLDNPNSINVEVLQLFGRDMIFDTNGKTAFVIFKINDGPRDFKQYFFPLKAAPTSNEKKYYQIPNKYVLDAVEAQPQATSARLPKKLNGYLDAGFASVPGGIYSSQSIIRKVATTINGRIVLQDTNDSTDDFQSTFPLPFGFK